MLPQAMLPQPRRLAARSPPDESSVSALLFCSQERCSRSAGKNSARVKKASVSHASPAELLVKKGAQAA